MNIKFVIQILLIGIISAMFFSCDDNSLGKMRERELELLDQFIKNNNITVKPTPSGLFYIEKVAGTGDSIKAGDIVDILYRTWLIDSTLVDENINAAGHFYEPLRFTVTPPGVSSSVVEGLNEGIKFMKQGTVAHLVVPSQIAYGQQGSGYIIPAFSTLLFEIRVYRVIRSSSSGQ
jgi:FKBP-type peptidyl-prolyl cis-trans isomerase